MLYRIARGGVAHYQDGQTPLVYLVTTIEDVRRAELRWVFSNGNCGAPTTEYFNDLHLLDAKVDWNLQEAIMWNDTADDPSRATRRAAEFLVHRQMPWRVIRWVVARTTATATAVEELCSDAGSQRVLVRPRWYFNGRKYR
jgi:ssDNA thymidine ADP-ribosyltransferase, DarT